MTTINEFDQQRQEIINECTKIIKGFGVGILNGLDNIVEKTKNLQPPRPTCSTCKYLHDTPDEWPRCNAWRKNQAISDMTDNDISNPEKMGCIHHSDYGDAE